MARQKWGLINLFYSLIVYKLIKVKANIANDFSYYPSPPLPLLEVIIFDELQSIENRKHWCSPNRHGYNNSVWITTELRPPYNRSLSLFTVKWTKQQMIFSNRKNIHMHFKWAAIWYCLLKNVVCTIIHSA